jgi:peroxiredoxin
MAATNAKVALSASAPEFRLPATDGKTYALADIAGAKGTVIVFICNHCPYVKAITDRLVRDAGTLKAEGIGFAAICSNDARSHPEDSFPNMKRFAEAHKFPFPYLHDEDQSVARAYGGVCTPDFFGFDAGGKLKYRGRLDEGRTSPPPAGARRELVEAMRAIAETGAAPAQQVPSVGCSIKWKAA